MRDKKLAIEINKPAREVFTFTLNPSNTPLWIDSIVKEEVNEQPVRVGSIYRNVGKDGKWSEYVVTKLDKNKMFEFTSRDGNYHVRYTFKPISEEIVEMEYYEWVDTGDLEEPFTQEVLKKLKDTLESNK